MRSFLSLITGVLLVIYPVFYSDSSAQGLCGRGGLIGGDIGRWCDKHIEGPITTPIARGATVAVTTAVGTVVGTALGAPVAGAAVGEFVGKTVNERAAGKSPPIGRPAVHSGHGAVESSVTFVITNSAQYQINVRIFAQSRPVSWPGQDKAFVLSDGDPHPLTIKCVRGEQVCYGAYYNTGKYWGAGRDNSKGCKDCCLPCTGGQNSWNLVD